MEMSNIIEGRNKIISNNNICIIETITFYEIILFNDIIKPFLFNKNLDKFPWIEELISEKLSFMEKYKIVCKIAKEYGITNFKRFDDYIRLRNKIAHNLSSVININDLTKESEINFAGEIITWTKYKTEIQEWSNLSLEMAEFIMKVFDKVRGSNIKANFVYCEMWDECVLVQYNLKYPEKDSDYICFFKNGFNMDLLEYVNKEFEMSEDNEIIKDNSN